MYKPVCFDIHDDFDKLQACLYTSLNNSPLVRKNIHVKNYNFTDQQQHMLNMIYPVDYIDSYDDSFMVIKDLQSKPIFAVEKIAVVVHLHYEEFFNEIMHQLEQLSVRYDVDVFMYVTDNIFSQVDDKPRDHYNFNLNIISTENLGRDIRSFLLWIDKGIYTDYDAVLKIHGKKTTYLHKNWRQTILTDLLSCEKEHFKYMMSENVHLSGTIKFDMVEKYNNTANTYSMNRIVKHMETDPIDQFSFYAGTMFWCSSVYCGKLYTLLKTCPDLCDKFEPEPIIADGTMAHAWERVLSNITRWT